MPSKHLRGPDTLDAAVMMTALGSLHAVSIHVELRPIDVIDVNNWMVELVAVSHSATPMVAPRTYRWSRVCLSSDMEDLGSILYNGCYELEKKLQHGQWVQMELPKEA